MWFLKIGAQGGVMSNHKLAWFDLNKYEKCKNLDAAGWAIEIGRRLEIEICMLPHNSHARHGALDLIEDIKKYGLFNSKPLSTEDKLSDFWILQKSKKFIENLTVFDILEFADGYEGKEEFELDYKVMEGLDLSNEARNNRKKILKKYSKPLSEEIVERYDRWDSLSNNDLGDRYLKVDINAPEEMLLKEFGNWLWEQKNNYDLNFPDKCFKESHFADWNKNKLLQYWDISNLAKYDNVNITYDVIGRLLFPDEYDVTISERVRKVIKPKAINLFKYEIEQALIAQVNLE